MVPSEPANASKDTLNNALNMYEHGSTFLNLFTIFSLFFRYSHFRGFRYDCPPRPLQQHQEDAWDVDTRALSLLGMLICLGSAGLPSTLGMRFLFGNPIVHNKFDWPV